MLALSILAVLVNIIFLIVIGPNAYRFVRSELAASNALWIIRLRSRLRRIRFTLSLIWVDFVEFWNERGDLGGFLIILSAIGLLWVSLVILS